jgi:parallel beta-helix repeat protein
MLGQTKVKGSSDLPVHNLNTGLDYTTIQEAIDASATIDGHTIKVDSGTYYEYIKIDKSITLVGEDPDVTVIDGNGRGMLTGFLSARAVIALKANSIQVMNFTIRNAGLNYTLEQYDACLDCKGQQDIDVENNILQNAGWGIVFGNGVSSATIKNNTISDTVGGAIDIGGWTSPNAANVTISNNIIHNGGAYAMELNGDTTNCTILNNTVADGYVAIALGPNVNNYVVPTHNLIEGNILNNNSGVNIEVFSSPYSSQSTYTNTFRRNNLTNVQHMNLLVSGPSPATFIQDIDTTNTVNNKKIYYIMNVSNSEIDPINSPDAGYLALVNCTNATAESFNFVSNNDGVLIAWSTNCSLTNVTLGNNHIQVTNALSNESYTSILGGVTLLYSTGNTITDCALYNNTCGIWLARSDENTLYHNSFIDNDMPVISDRDDPFENVSSGYFSRCSWNNSLEGNYWSDYNGSDSNNDGIGDSPYIIDAHNTDHYPLNGIFNNCNVTYFTLPIESHTCNVAVISNSTISGFVAPIWIEHPETIFLEFNVTGEQGSTGFCRVSFPTAMMNGTYQVHVNGTQVSSTLLPCSNADYSYLYFTYKHSTEGVIITPEFPLFLILPMLMLTTLVVVIPYKRKKEKLSIPSARALFMILSVYYSKSRGASSHQKLYVKPEDCQNSKESEEKFIA